MTTHQQQAHDKWPKARIEGDGPFGLLVQRDGLDIVRVVLFPTLDAAERSRDFYDASIIQNVEPRLCPDLPRCRDIYPD